MRTLQYFGGYGRYWGFRGIKYIAYIVIKLIKRKPKKSFWEKQKFINLNIYLNNFGTSFPN